MSRYTREIDTQAAVDTRRPGYPEGRDPQHVLKAEGASSDATDRGNRATASPGGGPMGAGQAAAAAPSGEPPPSHWCPASGRACQEYCGAECERLAQERAA